MNKLLTFFGTIVFVSFLLFSCSSGTSPRDKAEIIKAYNDSIAKVEKAKQDSLTSILPEIKVSIFERTGVGYDAEGWPVVMGRVVLVKDFQERKEHQLKDYDYIEKIEISGQSDNITLQFINAKNNKILYEEKAISLSGSKTYTTSDPTGKKLKNYQDWLNTKFDQLIIKVLYKDRIVFEGKIIPAK